MHTTHSPAYAFEDRVDEHRRLIEQSILFDPLTSGSRRYSHSCTPPSRRPSGAPAPSSTSACGFTR